MKSNIGSALLVAAMAIVIALVFKSFTGLPVVYKSYSTGQITKITIEGKEVPRSQYKQILAGRYHNQQSE